MLLYNPCKFLPAVVGLCCSVNLPNLQRRSGSWFTSQSTYSCICLLTHQDGPHPQVSLLVNMGTCSSGRCSSGVMVRSNSWKLIKGTTNRIGCATPAHRRACTHEHTNTRMQMQAGYSINVSKNLIQSFSVSAHFCDVALRGWNKSRVCQFQLNCKFCNSYSNT